MKNLMYKEWKLAMHPTTFIFLSFGLMLLIPNYPGYVAIFYMCLSIFFVFLSGRENKDIFFTVMLPIRKRDVVKARVMMVAGIELTQLLLSIPFAILGANLYAGIGNQAGIEPNIAFYGLAFVMFAVFNVVFIPNFYKTAYKIGIPFLMAGVAVLFYYVAAELLVWIPGPLQTFLDTSDPVMMLPHLPILIAGIGIWFLSLVFAYRRGAARFEHVDL
ncbi:MAG: ABC-2 transporter permease [bacterium]